MRNMWWTLFINKLSILLSVFMLIFYVFAGFGFYRILKEFQTLEEFRTKFLLNFRGETQNFIECSPAYINNNEDYANNIDYYVKCGFNRDNVDTGGRGRANGIINDDDVAGSSDENDDRAALDEYHLQNFSKNLQFTLLPHRTRCRTNAIGGRTANNSTNQNRDDVTVSSSSTTNQNQRLPPSTGGRPTVFVVVKSRPYEAFQRAAIRDTYGAHFWGRLIFVVGETGHSDVETALKLEHTMHGDILRANFNDSYFNLSYKSLAILRWIVDHCPNESFYVQADSDALLYPKNLHKFAARNHHHRRGRGRPAGRIYGHCWRNARVLRAGKWRVPERRYGSAHYPEYCSGAAFMMTGDVPRRLLASLQRGSAYMSVDDAYFTGILAEKAGVNRVNYAGFKFRSELSPQLQPPTNQQRARAAAASDSSCPCQQLLASFEYKSPDAMRLAWQIYAEAESRCSMSM